MVTRPQITVWPQKLTQRLILTVPAVVAESREFLKSVLACSEFNRQKLGPTLTAPTWGGVSHKRISSLWDNSSRNTLSALFISRIHSVGQNKKIIEHINLHYYRCPPLHPWWVFSFYCCVVECWICNWEVAGSNLGLGYFAPRSTQPSIPPGSVNEYQL